jgi:hypothetical protein
MYSCQSRNCPLNAPGTPSGLYYVYMNKNKTTASTLISGQVVQAGYKRRNLMVDPNRFVGFKVNGQFFSELKLLKQHFGVSNLKDLEFEADRQEIGSVIAEFYATEGEYFWGAYLWNGAFRVGTSADRLVLA